MRACRVRLPCSLACTVTGHSGMAAYERPHNAHAGLWLLHEHFEDLMKSTRTTWHMELYISHCCVSCMCMLCVWTLRFLR